MNMYVLFHACMFVSRVGLVCRRAYTHRQESCRYLYLRALSLPLYMRLHVDVCVYVTPIPFASPVFSQGWRLYLVDPDPRVPKGSSYLAYKDRDLGAFRRADDAPELVNMFEVACLE